MVEEIQTRIQDDARRQNIRVIRLAQRSNVPEEWKNYARHKTMAGIYLTSATRRFMQEDTLSSRMLMEHAQRHVQDVRDMRPRDLEAC